MKKMLLYIAIALAAIGCAKSDVALHPPASDEIHLSAGFTTRVSSDDDCAWDGDGKDQVGLFTTQTGESNLLFSVNKDGDMTNMSGSVLIPLDEGARSYYAYHPYSSSQSTTTMAIDLTAGYITPLLWAATSSNDTAVELKFTHMLPKVTFNITAGGAEVETFDAVATLSGAYATGNFDITSGAFSDEATADISLSIVDGKVTAYLMPMTAVSSSVKLWITAEGDTYLYSLTSYDTWEIGNKYEYDVVVGEKINADND
ncbi:MAG: fimbrillin family protein [Rikenellaceae bacterium]